MGVNGLEPSTSRMGTEDGNLLNGAHPVPILNCVELRISDNIVAIKNAF